VIQLRHSKKPASPTAGVNACGARIPQSTDRWASRPAGYPKIACRVSGPSVTFSCSGGSVPVFVEVRQELRGILPSLRACAGAIKNVTEHRPFIDPELSPERLIFPNRSVGLSTRIGLKVTTEGTN